MSKARKQLRKINGVIDKRDLAEIFRRAESLIAKDPERRALLDARRNRGRLGKALIQELLNRAVISDALAEARAPREAPAPSPAASAPAVAPEPILQPKKPAPKAAPSAEKRPAPELPSEREERARRLLAKVDHLTDASEYDTLDDEENLVAPAHVSFGATPAAKQPPVEPVAEYRDPKDSSSEDARQILEAEVTVEQRALADTHSFLTLSDLTKSLSTATRRHLDEQAAMRTMIEDLEMPDPVEQAEIEAAKEKVRSAEEISFEGYLEDIEKLLVETYEHYKSMPEAFGPQPVDPGDTDLLGPEGRTLESRRADRKAGRTSGRVSRAVYPEAIEHLPTSAIPAPWPKPSPLASAPQAFAPPTVPRPDPFAVDPFSASVPPDPGGQLPPPRSPGPNPDPFAVDPYTGRPVEQSIADPFAVDPFAPFAGESGTHTVPQAGPGPAYTPPSPFGSGAYGSGAYGSGAYGPSGAPPRGPFAPEGSGGFPQAGPPAAGGYPPVNAGGFPPANAGGFPQAGPPAPGGFPPANAGGFPPANAGGFPPANAGGFPAQPNAYPAHGGFPPAPGAGFPPAGGGFAAQPPAQVPGAAGQPSSQRAEAAQESYGFDTLMDAGESKLPNESRLGESATGDAYSWPKGPPDALKDAIQKADEALKMYDPFAADPPSAPQQGVPGQIHVNPFGPMGTPVPAARGGPVPTPGLHGRPIYIQNSDEILPPDPALGPKETKRAFENALVMAGLRGMLEYQRPEPGHGASHPVMVIFDTQRNIFKAPLTPKMSIGDRFQLRDGRVFRITGCQVFEVQGVPCYQEAMAKPLGSLNMPLRDSWETS